MLTTILYLCQTKSRSLRLWGRIYKFRPVRKLRNLTGLAFSDRKQSNRMSLNVRPFTYTLSMLSDLDGRKGKRERLKPQMRSNREQQIKKSSKKFKRNIFLSRTERERERLARVLSVILTYFLITNVINVQRTTLTTAATKKQTNWSSILRIPATTLLIFATNR